MKTIREGLLIGIAGGIIVFALIMSWRLGETWSIRHTDLLLGGFLVIFGGALILVAAFIGAGAFARLAAWRPPRQEIEQPIEVGRWRELPPSTPPWGVTGGGQFDLLPSPRSDRRYRLEAPEVQRINIG